MKALRIVSCVLAALSLAAITPVGIFCPIEYISIPVVATGIFAAFMLLARRHSPPEPPQSVNFMNTDEENEAIRRHQDEEKK